MTGTRNPGKGRLTEEGNRPESMAPGGVKNRNGTTFPGEVRQPRNGARGDMTVVRRPFFGEGQPVFRGPEPLSGTAIGTVREFCVALQI